MSQNEIAILVQGLKKSYKNIPVLTGVDFQVETGSIFALLGSNGTGTIPHVVRHIPQTAQGQT